MTPYTLQAEAFQQHDVQEMMTTLITFLESSGADLAAYIEDHHRGRLADYIEFVGVPADHNRERVDPFHDVQLTIKGVQSVTEALRGTQMHFFPSTLM